jgi:elongation factor Ts
MVEISTSDPNVASSEQLKRTGTDIAMHITATKPLALDKDGIAADVIEREKSIYADQVKNKPANIVDKIVEGKLNKFFEDNCLLDQKFVKETLNSGAGTGRRQGGRRQGDVKKIRQIDIG